MNTDYMFNQEPNVKQVHLPIAKTVTTHPDSEAKTPQSDNANYLSRSDASIKGVAPFAKNYGIGEVLSLLGGSRATHYNRLNPKSPYFDPLYPKPIKNGRLSIYLSSEVAAYLADRVSVRDNDP